MKFQGLRYERAEHHLFSEVRNKPPHLHSTRRLENGTRVNPVRVLPAVHIFGDDPLTHLLAIHKATIFEWDLEEEWAR